MLLNLSLYIDQNLFLEVHNFPPTSLLENCSLLVQQHQNFNRAIKIELLQRKTALYINILGVIIQFSYYLLHGVKGVLKSGGFHPTMAMKHHSPANINTQIVTNRRIGKRKMKPTKISNFFFQLVSCSR